MDGGQLYEGHPAACNLVDYTDAERAEEECSLAVTGWVTCAWDLLSEANAVAARMLPISQGSQK